MKFCLPTYVAQSNFLGFTSNIEKRLLRRYTQRICKNPKTDSFKNSNCKCPFK